MSKSRIAFGIWLLVWLLILHTGFSLYLSIIDQHVPGYPNSGQLEICLIYPGFWVLLNIFLVALPKKVPLLAKLIAVVIQLPAAFMFFFIVSGGV